MSRSEVDRLYQWPGCMVRVKGSRAGAEITVRGATIMGHVAESTMTCSRLDTARTIRAIRKALCELRASDVAQ